MGRDFIIVSRGSSSGGLFAGSRKEIFCSLMRKTEAFCGVQILTYALLSNHFHILVYVPEREDISDAELISRLRIFYSGPLIDQFAQQLQEARRWAMEIGTDSAPSGPYG